MPDYRVRVTSSVSGAGFEADVASANPDGAVLTALTKALATRVLRHAEPFTGSVTQLDGSFRGTINEHGWT